jgi:hypothetical protein
LWLRISWLVKMQISPGRTSMASEFGKLWQKLHEGVAGSYTALELGLQRIQFFPLFMPHQLDVTDRAGVIEQ